MLKDATKFKQNLFDLFFKLYSFFWPMEDKIEIYHWRFVFGWSHHVFISFNQDELDSFLFLAPDEKKRRQKCKNFGMWSVETKQLASI